MSDLDQRAEEFLAWWLAMASNIENFTPVADLIRDLLAARAPVGWQDISTAPYETPMLTCWPGSDRLNHVILINTKNSGQSLGKRAGWWHSKPDQTPTLWQPLPSPPVKNPPSD